MKHLVHIVLMTKEHEQILKAIRETLSDDPPVEWYRELGAALVLLEQSCSEEEIRVGGTI